MKNPGISRKRKIIGVVLALAALCSCLSGLSSVRSGIRDEYAASGRSGDFEVPALPDGTVSINFGDAGELMALPGIGEHLARLILDERETNGLFHYPEDLLCVKGIGPAKLGRMRPLLDMTDAE